MSLAAPLSEISQKNRIDIRSEHRLRDLYSASQWLVPYILGTCTPHRPTLYSASRSAKPTRKTTRRLAELLRAAALSNIYRLGNRDSRVSPAQGSRTCPSADFRCSDSPPIPPTESACIVLSRDIAGCSRKTETRRISWRMRTAVAAPGQPDARHAGVFSLSRAMVTGRSSQVPSDIGTRTESAVDIWLTRAGGAAPDALNPATARLVYRSTFLSRPSQQATLIEGSKRTTLLPSCGVCPNAH